MKANYIYVTTDLKSESTLDVAENLYNFLLFQYKTAAREVIKSQSVRESCNYANRLAIKKSEDEDEYDLGGVGGWTICDLPYSESKIKHMEEEAKLSEENLKVHRATLDFFVKTMMKDAWNKPTEEQIKHTSN